MTTKRTITVESPDVVVIRCSKLEAARIANSLKANAELFQNTDLGAITSMMKNTGAELMTFAREIASTIDMPL